MIRIISCFWTYIRVCLESVFVVIADSKEES